MHKPSAPDPRLDDQPACELPAIEFVAQGSFSIYNPDNSRPATAWQPAAQQPRQNTQPLRISGIASLRSHTLALIQQAQHNLCIYSSDLEPWLYNHSCIQHACTQLLLSNPRNSLRILLHDSSRISREGHRLLALSQRLSSRCHIRTVNLDHAYAQDFWLSADDCGLLVRQAQQLQTGMVYYHDPARALQNLRLFNAMWDVSRADINLRSMPL